MTEGSGEMLVCPNCEYETRVFDGGDYRCPECGEDQLREEKVAYAISRDREHRNSPIEDKPSLSEGEAHVVVKHEGERLKYTGLVESMDESLPARPRRSHSSSVNPVQDHLISLDLLVTDHERRDDA
jgi:RNA polymerase subunit RPABC4/transcription elongation factor Spt4